jgi:hypothetical protein
MIIGLQLTDRRYNCSLIDGTSICLCRGDECPNAEHCGQCERGHSVRGRYRWRAVWDIMLW